MIRPIGIGKYILIATLMLVTNFSTAGTDLHWLWDNRCAECHGHSAEFSRKFLRVTDGQLQGSHHTRNLKLFMRNHYAPAGEVFEELEARGIEAVIKPRRNSVPGTASPARGRAVEEFLELGYEGWAVEKGYGRRWAVETAFSTFKRLFGEHSLARSMDCITRELVAKVSLYNMLVNM